MGTPPAWALVAAYRQCASLGPGYPSGGWVTPPGLWALLSSLTQDEFFNNREPTTGSRIARDARHGTRE